MKTLRIIILSAAVLAVAGCGMSLYSGDVSQIPQDSNSIADVNEMPQKANLWDVANGVIDISITIAAMFSGAAWLRIAAGLKTARDKSKALKEIIEANELFKKSNPESANNFKAAQSQTQSDTTRAIVAQMK